MKFLLFSLTIIFFLLLKNPGHSLSTSGEIVPTNFWGEFKKNTQIFKEKGLFESFGLTPSETSQFSLVISQIGNELKSDEFDPDSLTQNLDILLNVSQYKKDSISAIDYINLLDIIENILFHANSRTNIEIDWGRLLGKAITVAMQFQYLLIHPSRTNTPVITMEMLQYFQSSLNKITSLLDQDLRSKFGDPKTLDLFDDVSEDLIKSYIISIEDQKSCSESKMEIIPKAIYKKHPIILSYDSKQNLVITMTGHYGFRDNLYTIGQAFNWNNLAHGKSFDLNGDSQVLKWAEQTMEILTRHLESSAFNIKETLQKGHRVRLIGHGVQGAIAELIAFQWKKSLFNEFNQNQIQSITFGTTGYLTMRSIHSGLNSSYGYNVIMEGNNIRFRFSRDSITPKSYYQCSNKMGQIFNIPQLDPNVVSTVADKWHSLVYYRGNLVNNGVFRPFRDMSFYYKLLKIEEEIVSSLINHLIPLISNTPSEKIDSHFIIDVLSQIESSFIDINRLRTLMTEWGINQNNVTKELNLLADNIISEPRNQFRFMPTLVGLSKALSHQNNLEDIQKRGSPFSNQISDQLGNIFQSDLLDKSNISTVYFLGRHYYSKFVEYFRNHEAHYHQLLDYIISNNLKHSANSLILDQLESSERERLQKMVAEGYLSTKLGKGYTRAGGATGSLLIKNIFSKPVGVFKGEGKNGWIKNHFGQRSRLSPHPMAQSYGELASFYFSMKTNFNITPMVLMVNYDFDGIPIEGAFLEFLDGYKPLDEEYFKDRQTFSEAELTRFQTMAIFDFAIGNMDRFADNLFVKMNRSTYDFANLKCIDNANSHPHSGPNQFNGHHMYYWKHYEISKSPFTNEALEKIDSLSENVLESYFMETAQMLPTYFNKNIKDYFRLRVAFLHQLIKSKAIKTPAEMAEYRSRSEITEAMN